MQGRRAFVDRGFDLVGGACAIIGSAGLLLLVGMTVADVFWRYALNDPLFGMSDLSTMVSAVIVACAVFWAALKKAHVTIELIEAHFGDRILAPLTRVINLLTSLLFCTASYALFKKSRCGFDCGNITDNLAIVHTPFYLALALSMLLCGVLSLWNALKRDLKSLEGN